MPGRKVHALLLRLGYTGAFGLGTSTSLKGHKRGIIERYARPDNAKGWVQILNTLLPLAALWWLVSLGPTVSWWIPVAATAAMCLILLRAFVLMHECGHGSLFANPSLNRRFGFLLGVISGMPQFVWSQHHAFHHSTNGNWAQYRGPLATLSTGEYEQLSAAQKRGYARARRLVMAPLGGFVYLLLNPRLTWLVGSARLVIHVLRGKLAQPATAWREQAASFQTPYWKSPAEYWHMTSNNLVLMTVWVLMSAWLGAALFFSVYIVATSLAGAAGIVLFTVQHNFENSYASGEEGWDYDKAALEGTSFLELPRWMEWITASIGYHHVHHLSARIPNYRLAECHRENQALFAAVPRLRLADVIPSLKCIVWDTQDRRIISIAAHEARRARPAGEG